MASECNHSKDYEKGFNDALNSNALEDFGEDLTNTALAAVSFGLLGSSDDYREGRRDGAEERDNQQS